MIPTLIGVRIFSRLLSGCRPMTCLGVQIAEPLEIRTLAVRCDSQNSGTRIRATRLKKKEL